MYNILKLESRKLIWIIFLGLSGLACESSMDNQIDLVGDLPDSDSLFQNFMVGQLSGKFKLNNGEKINSRWSPEERVRTRNYLISLLRKLGLEPRQHRYISRNLNPGIDLMFAPFRGTNVYAILPATIQSNEYIVLGAHYDTGKRFAPGAIDNATGMTLITTVANNLRKLKERKKNIIIVYFDQEEEEQIGSAAFGRLLLKKNWDIHSVHCFDMVGWDGDHDNAMEDFSASVSLLTLYRNMASKHNIPINEIEIDPVGYKNQSTDFDVFVPMGFNVIGAGECFYHGDYSPYKDSPDDIYETVDFKYLYTCTALIQDVIENLVSQ